mgnify:FL=1
MLLRKFDFSDSESRDKFIFDKEIHLATWEHYCDCYSYTLEKIFNKGLQRNYALNCRARAILFLIRHYYEICLKKNLALNGYIFTNTHDLKELLDCFQDQSLIPVGFKDLVTKLNYDLDGACFRYYLDNKTGKPFFDYKDRIELSEIIKKYSGIVSSDKFKIDKICEPFDYDNRIKKWNFTFHMGECRGLGHIRTQYDNVIEFLVEGVLFESYDVNKVYLPLLFLVRHSLELALKHNLSKARKLTNIVSDKRIEKIHSLEQLYNLFGGSNGYINKVDIEKMDLKTQEQLNDYKRQYEELNTTIHQLDTNSMFFRFPVDSKGKNHSIYMKGHRLFEILKLYYLTDPFITFTNDVLIEEGLLTE